MTEDLYSELLSREEVAWLTEGELSSASPLSSFGGLAERATAQSPAQRGLSGEPWDRVVAVLRRPRSRVRITVPGATESFVQYFLGSGSEDDGLVGCWLEGDGLRVSYPWPERDVVSLVSQVVLPTAPEAAETDTLVLSADGLAALCASVDAIRQQFFASMADRRTDVEYRIDRATLKGQAAAGSESTDARWLLPMLRLTAFLPPVADAAVDRGVAELVESGLLVGQHDDWRPGPTLLTLAIWWRNPLPAISCEGTRFDNGRVSQHEHRVIIRGNGPLCVLHQTGGPAAGLPVTIGSIDPLDYFDEMTRALRRVTTSEPEFVYVVEPIAVRDLSATNAVAGYLQPGRWYHVEGEAGAWAQVMDPSGPLVGWAPVAELCRRVEAADGVVAIDAEAPPRQPAWEATHVVPAGGLSSWASPDGGTAPIADLAAGVELQVTERQSAWAAVRAENGWEAWVDGRRLAPMGAAVAESPASPASAAAGTESLATVESDSVTRTGADRMSLMAAIALLGAVLVLAAIGISNLSTESEQTAATVATTSSAAPSTSGAPTTTARVATTTSTTTPPIVLTVAHWFYSPVFQARDDDGELSGFEIDLVDELMERIGAEVNWVETDLTTLYDGTAAGTYDLAVGGLAVLDVRLNDIRYSTPYFVPQYGLLVESVSGSNVTSFADLSTDDVVAVLRSTRAAEWAEANLAPIGVQVVDVESSGEARDALRSGAVDALISSALYPLAAAGRLEPLRLVDAAATGNVVAFAVDAAQPELLTRVDAALAAAIEDGTYQEIYDRWFAHRAGSVASPQS